MKEQYFAPEFDVVAYPAEDAVVCSYEGKSIKVNGKDLSDVIGWVD